MSVQLQDLELLEELRDFTLAHTHPEIQSFKPAMRDWGNQWIEMPIHSLPAAGHLAEQFQ